MPSKDPERRRQADRDYRARLKAARAAREEAARADGASDSERSVHEKKERLRQGMFLMAYAATGNISESCRQAEISRGMHYRWMEHDAEYSLRFKTAEDAAVDALEGEARRRALEGTDEPVYQGGRLVGTIRKYSDVLLIFLLKGYRPRFRDRVDVNVDINRIAEEVARDTGLPVDEIIAEAMAITKGTRR